MAVDIHRHGELAMTQSLLHHLWVDIVGEGMAGPGVSQIMESDLGESMLRHHRGEVASHASRGLLLPAWPCAGAGCGQSRDRGSLYSSLPKRNDSRLVILTSAGDPSHPSYKVLTEAKASGKWHVNEVPGPVPWIADDELAEQKRVLPAWDSAGHEQAGKTDGRGRFCHA